MPALTPERYRHALIEQAGLLAALVAGPGRLSPAVGELSRR